MVEFISLEVFWRPCWPAKDWVISEGILGVVLRDREVGNGGKAQSCEREASDNEDRFECNFVFRPEFSSGDCRPEE